MYLEETVKKNMDVLKGALKEEAGKLAVSECTSNSETLRTKELFQAASGLMDAFVEFVKQWDEMRENQLKIINQQRETTELIRTGRYQTLKGTETIKE